MQVLLWSKRHGLLGVVGVMLLMAICRLDDYLPERAQQHDLTVAVGLYSVPWRSVMLELASKSAQSAPLHPTLQGELSQHGLASLADLTGSNGRTGSSIIAAVIPATRVLNAMDNGSYVWPKLQPLRRLLQDHKYKEMMVAHVFDPNSLNELLQSSDPYAFRHLHAFLVVQLTLLLESHYHVCYSWIGNQLQNSAVAIERMLKQIDALPTYTLHDMSYIGLRPLLLAMQSLCLSPAQPSIDRDHGPLPLDAKGMATRLYQGAHAVIKRQLSASEQPAAEIPSRPRAKAVFFAGLEGTGHHLWRSVLSKCAPHVCGEKRFVSLALRDLSLMTSSGSIGMVHTRQWLANLYTAEVNKQLTFLNCYIVQKTLSLPAQNDMETLFTINGSLTFLPSDSRQASQIVTMPGAFSFPSFDGKLKPLQYPDITVFQRLANLDWNASLHVVVLLRDPVELLLSTLRRGFGTVEEQLATLTLNSRVLLSQLTSLRVENWICWDFNTEARHQCLRIALYLGVTAEQLDLCALLEKGQQEALTRSRNRAEKELKKEIVSQMEELYAFYFAMRELCVWNSELRLRETIEP
eukprot:m.123020 g.123020  ORF g.123020 m.123020 type:complete len:577 (-) comp15669_c1_seq2:2586-4316(-)